MGEASLAEQLVGFLVLLARKGLVRFVRHGAWRRCLFRLLLVFVARCAGRVGALLDERGEVRWGAASARAVGDDHGAGHSAQRDRRVLVCLGHKQMR